MPSKHPLIKVAHCTLSGTFHRNHAHATPLSKCYHTGCKLKRTTIVALYRFNCLYTSEFEMRTFAYSVDPGEMSHCVINHGLAYTVCQ